MAKRSSFGPMVLVMAALSCSFYVACGDDDVIIGNTAGSGGSGGGGGSSAGSAGTGGGGSGGAAGSDTTDAGSAGMAGEAGQAGSSGEEVDGGVDPDAGDGGPSSSN